MEAVDCAHLFVFEPRPIRHARMLKVEVAANRDNLLAMIAEASRLACAKAFAITFQHCGLAMLWREWQRK